MYAQTQITDLTPSDSAAGDAVIPAPTLRLCGDLTTSCTRQTATAMMKKTDKTQSAHHGLPNLFMDQAVPILAMRLTTNYVSTKLIKYLYCFLVLIIVLHIKLNFFISCSCQDTT